MALAPRGPVWDDAGVDWGALDRTVIRSTWDYTIRLPSSWPGPGGVPLTAGPTRALLAAAAADTRVDELTRLHQALLEVLAGLGSIQIVRRTPHRRPAHPDSIAGNPQ